jgi:hypothetical protein
MFTHGWEPKVILVSSYWRWQSGKLVRVKAHLRVLDPRLHVRWSELQLTLGFY